MFYSKKAIEYFTNPKHVGKIDKANSIGKAGDPNCGDQLVLYLLIKNNVIKKIKYKCHGCPAAISTSEALCVLAENKTIDEAKEINDALVLAHLGCLPEGKEHCSLLGTEALMKAIYNYETTK